MIAWFPEPMEPIRTESSSPALSQTAVSVSSGSELAPYNEKQRSDKGSWPNDNIISQLAHILVQKKLGENHRLI